MSSGIFGNKFSPRIFRKARFGVDKFILVQKYKIHYVEAGQGEPVILLPGSYNTRRTWNRLMPLLASDFHLLVLDYIGCLESGQSPEFTLQEQTDIIAKLVRQIGLPKVNLIGGYYGGAIVYDFAARYPDLVNKIISLEGSLVQADPESGHTHNTAKTRKPSRLPWYKISLKRLSILNIEEEAKSIKAPLLYLYGSKSDVKRIQLARNLEYLKTHLPLAWVVQLEGSIHDLNTQKPSDIAGMILEFLSKKLEPRK